jgi:hypothetical protein
MELSSQKRRFHRVYAKMVGLTKSYEEKSISILSVLSFARTSPMPLPVNFLKEKSHK